MPHNVISALKRNKVLIHSMTYINLKRITGEKKAKKKYTPYSTDKGKNKTEKGDRMQGVAILNIQPEKTSLRREHLKYILKEVREPPPRYVGGGQCRQCRQRAQ